MLLETAGGFYEISDDPDRFDVDVFHSWISEHSYWATGRLRQTTDTSLRHSTVFGVYSPAGSMVGAARVVTDHATFAWLCDVFVIDAHRGLGLGKALVEAVVSEPSLRNIKRFVLATGDAHGLYEPFGFSEFGDVEKWMVRLGDTV